MVQGIFVNLPVKDLARSKAFFEALGFAFNPDFTDDKAGCLILGEAMFAMLLTEPFFASFTDKPISDAHAATEVLVALQIEDRAAVDAMVAKAVAAGGTARRPAKDHGFMYQHGFEDPDGHIWEVFWITSAPKPA